MADRILTSRGVMNGKESMAALTQFAQALLWGFLGWKYLK
jgi:hypothetical protein